MRKQAAFTEPTLDQVGDLLQAFLGKRIAVIGDAMLDAYVIGNIDRISPEAPVPVLAVQREDWMLGGAANVAKCLVALGAKVRVCTVVGRDRDGELFSEELRNLGIDDRGVVVDAARPTTRKTRVIAHQQQVVRLDQETTQPLAGTIEKRLIQKIQSAAKWADAVILSGYAKGVLTDAVCRAAIQAAGRTPVLVDPKKLPWQRFRGATVLKPNRREAEQFAGEAIEDGQTAGTVAKRLAKQLSLGNVLITRGGDGMSLAASGVGVKSKRLHHFSAHQREVFDVTGAGDVVITALALGLASGADMATATWLANIAAGVKVGKFGAATVTGQEILETLGHAVPDFERKVLSRDEAAAFAAEQRRAGKQVVFTNGCFDILHVGHVNYLEKSRRQGDALIVGINTDASVRRLKGAGRPVQREADRAQIIASQACVDAVVLFDEDTPLKLIKAIKPTVLTKGADYKRKQDIVGWDVVEKHGGRVARIDLVAGRSTTKLIAKTSK